VRFLSARFTHPHCMSESPHHVRLGGDRGSRQLNPSAWPSPAGASPDGRHRLRIDRRAAGAGGPRRSRARHRTARIANAHAHVNVIGAYEFAKRDDNIAVLSLLQGLPIRAVRMSQARSARTARPKGTTRADEPCSRSTVEVSSRDRFSHALRPLHMPHVNGLPVIEMRVSRPSKRQPVEWSGRS
jgi:hypothetical protein